VSRLLHGIVALALPVAAASSADDIRRLDELNAAGRYREAIPAARELLGHYEISHGPDSPNVAALLDRLVVALTAGDPMHPDTTPHAERAVRLNATLHGQESSELAHSLFNQARLRKECGDPAAALAMHERALAIRETALGPNHPDVALSLIEAGRLIGVAEGRPEEAFALFERAESILSSSVESRHRSVGLLLQARADLHGFAGNLDTSADLQRRSIALREETLGPQHPDLGMSYNNLGKVLEKLGEYAEAEAAFVRASSIWEAALGESHPHVAIGLINRARMFWFGMLDPVEARTMLERALEIQERALGPEHPTVAWSLANLGGLLAHVGDFAGALPLIERELAIRETALGPNAPLVAQSLFNLAFVEYEIGDYVAARDRLQRSLRIAEDVFGPVHDKVAQALLWIGEAERELGDDAAAARAFARVVEIVDGGMESEADRAYVATAFHRLAAMHAEEGRFEEARRLHGRGLGLREQIFGPDHPFVAESLVETGRTLELEGRREEARELYERALRLRTAAWGEEHPLVARARLSVALVDARRGELDAALRSALEAVEIGRAGLLATARVLPGRQVLGQVAMHRTFLDAVTTLGVSQADEPETVRGVWNAVVRSRALALDEMAARNRTYGASTSGEFATQLEELRSARRRLAHLTVGGHERLDAEAFVEILRGLREETERLETALARKSQGLRRELNARGVGLEHVLQALHEGSALVAFVRYRAIPVGTTVGVPETVERYAAFVARAGNDPPTLVPLGKAEEIDRLVSTFHVEAASHPGLGREATSTSVRELREAGERLRAAIWDPLAPHIAGRTRVLIVPDGALHLVSFAALPDGESFLVEKGPLIHYLSSERDVVGRSRARNRDTLLALGDPDFDRSGSPSTRAAVPATPRSEAYRGPRASCVDFATEQFASLPASGLETAEVSRLWTRARGPDSTTTLTASSASEEAFKRLAPRSTVLHLATHGFFLETACRSASELAAGENPLLVSGLVLAGANRRAEIGPGEEDGILTAEEIASLDLSGVDWAVLSACETGVGEVVPGEGVLGLRRAFEIAGAGSLIMSLWAVDDQATRSWMRALYESRLRGAPTPQAVREAARSVLAARRNAGLSAHPFYWGAFVSAGDWR
jgi:CHAT domain-containing protein/tetratricopeptide (TPR) repeat protein